MAVLSGGRSEWWPYRVVVVSTVIESVGLKSMKVAMIKVGSLGRYIDEKIDMIIVNSVRS